MSTNYHARIIPKKEDIKELHELIDTNNFSEIKIKTFKLYDRFRPYNIDDKIQGEIHLGNRAGGWKFNWNPNIYRIRDGYFEKIDNKDGSWTSRWIWKPDKAYYVYPLTKKGIKAFIDREDVEIFDEYNEKQNKDEFWKMALNWGKEGLDSDSYSKEHPNEYHWNMKNDYTDFLESLGYKLSKYKSDFYSDGLRFCTSTEFG